MGKETIIRTTSYFSTYKDTIEHERTSKNIAMEANVVWNERNIIHKSEIQENGEVHMLIKNGDETINVTFKEVMNKGTTIQELIKKLLEMKIIRINTRIVNFLKYQENMWCKTDITKCNVNLGDSFMTIIENPTSIKSLKNQFLGHIKKCIRKPADKLYNN